MASSPECGPSQVDRCQTFHKRRQIRGEYGRSGEDHEIPRTRRNPTPNWNVNIHHSPTFSKFTWELSWASRKKSLTRSLIFVIFLPTWKIGSMIYCPGENFLFSWSNYSLQGAIFYRNSGTTKLNGESRKCRNINGRRYWNKFCNNMNFLKLLFLHPT